MATASEDGGMATLEDAYTGRPKLNDLSGLPDPISTRRLVRYSPNVDPALEEERFRAVERLIRGDYAAVVCAQSSEIILIRADEIRQGKSVHGLVMRVPVKERHGGWSRRPWKETEEKRTVVWDELLGRVRLVPETNCLDADSLAWLLKWTGGFVSQD